MKKNMLLFVGMALCYVPYSESMNIKSAAEAKQAQPGGSIAFGQGARAATSAPGARALAEPQYTLANIKQFYGELDEELSEPYPCPCSVASLRTIIEEARQTNIPGLPALIQQNAHVNQQLVAYDGMIQARTIELSQFGSTKVAHIYQELRSANPNTAKIMANHAAAREAWLELKKIDDRMEPSFEKNLMAIDKIIFPVKK